MVCILWLTVMHCWNTHIQTIEGRDRQHVFGDGKIKQAYVYSECRMNINEEQIGVEVIIYVQVFINTAVTFLCVAIEYVIIELRMCLCAVFSHQDISRHTDWYTLSEWNLKNKVIVLINVV